MLHQGTRWVMRVARLRACQGPSGDEAFARAFAQRQLTASPSRLSRWEYGRSGASYRVLRAYEDGAALPPYLLFALNDRQQRADSDTFASRPTIAVTDGVSADDVYGILDRAVLGREVSGSDWYTLAASASAHGYFYLSPSNTRLIARRLLEELARSIGYGYLLRFEAVHLFASMARLNEALLDEFRALVTSTETGMVGDTVSLLLRPPAPAARVLARELTAARSPAARQGVTWIESIVRDRAPQGDAAFRRHEVVQRREAICQDLPAWAVAHVEDDVTEPLVDTALGGRSRRARHEASALLMAAGIRDGLDGPLLDAFEAERDPVLRTRLAQLHEYLIPPSDPGRIERLALAEEDPETRRALWNARGHAQVPVHAGPQLMAQLGDPEAGPAASVALGLTGSVDDDLLAGVDDQVRAVLGWWRARGPALAS